MNLRLAAAAVLVLIGVFGIPDVSKFKPTPASDAVVDIHEPSETMKKAVYAVGAATDGMSPIDRFWFSQTYMNAARMVEADGQVPEPSILSTDGIRQINKTALTFVWKGMAANAPGKYPKLKEAVDGVLDSVIGLDRKKVTPEVRDTAVELFEAIAWVGRGN